MRELSEYIQTTLLADSTISGIIGANLFPDFVPEKTSYPVMTFSLAHMVGTISKDPDNVYKEFEVLFDAYANVKGQTYDLIDRVEELFNRMPLTDTGVITIGGVYITDGGSAIVGESNIYKQYLELVFRVYKP